MCLDQIYRQLWFSDEQNLLLVSGRKISEESFASYFDPGAQKIAEELLRVTKIYRKLRIDRTELICLMMFSMFILDERVKNDILKSLFIPFFSPSISLSQSELNPAFLTTFKLIFPTNLLAFTSL